jgi:DNA repair protein RadC
MKRPTVPTVGEPSFYHPSIPAWPPGERPREKLLQSGASALSDAELVAVVLRTGADRVTAVDLASTLLREFGSLRVLASRTPQDLRRFRGLGPAKSLALVAAFELGRRAAAAPREDRVRITSPEMVAALFQPVLRDLHQEVFKVLLLDSANNLLRDVTVTTGLLNSSLVHPREVFRPAILEPAASVILLHNHPSGNPEPSAEDIAVTKQLAEAGRVFGIPVHDHVIVTPESYTSFAERGLI